MIEVDGLSEAEEHRKAIVEWERRHGPLVGRWDGAVVATATLGALALLGLTAGAYLAGRADGRKLN